MIGIAIYREKAMSSSLNNTNSNTFEFMPTAAATLFINVLDYGRDAKVIFFTF